MIYILFRILSILLLYLISFATFSEESKELTTPGPSLDFFEEAVIKAIESKDQRNLEYLLREFGIHCGGRHLAVRSTICEGGYDDCANDFDRIFGYERDLAIAMYSLDYEEVMSDSQIEELVDRRLVEVSSTVKLWLLNHIDVEENSLMSSFLFKEEVKRCAEMTSALYENTKEMFK